MQHSTMDSRRSKEGITAVNLDTWPINKSLIDKTDSATKHFIASKKFNSNGPMVCYHRSNTIAKVLRGSLATNCLEIDIVVQVDNSILAYHPPTENNTGLLLSDILNVVEKNQKLSFWLDGKNLNEKKACTTVYNYLTKNKLNNKQFLLEFPTRSHQNTKKISSCIKKLKSIENIRLSYYVPTYDAINCSQALRSNADKSMPLKSNPLKFSLDKSSPLKSNPEKLKLERSMPVKSNPVKSTPLNPT